MHDTATTTHNDPQGLRDLLYSIEENIKRASELVGQAYSNLELMVVSEQVSEVYDSLRQAMGGVSYLLTDAIEEAASVQAAISLWKEEHGNVEILDALREDRPSAVLNVRHQSTNDPASAGFLLRNKKRRPEGRRC